jgi:hypothetical protein
MGASTCISAWRYFLATDDHLQDRYSSSIPWTMAGPLQSYTLALLTMMGKRMSLARPWELPDAVTHLLGLVEL